MSQAGEYIYIQSQQGVLDFKRCLFCGEMAVTRAVWGRRRVGKSVRDRGVQIWQVLQCSSHTGSHWLVQLLHPLWCLAIHPPLSYPSMPNTMWVEVEVSVREVWGWWKVCLHVGESGTGMELVVGWQHTWKLLLTCTPPAPLSMN